MPCPGSVTMALAYPETEQTEEATEGDAVHGMGAEMIHGAATAQPFVYAPGASSPEGGIVTGEMCAAATMYANDVITEMRARKVFGTSLGVEEQVTCPNVHAESDGTTDSYLYDEPDARLIIWDLKYGYLPVEVFENWQLINYFDGIVEKLGLDEQGLTVEFRIVQPRAYHAKGPVRKWIIDAYKLRGYVNRLSNAAHKALSSNVTYNSGSHCRYCPGRHACDAALAGGLQMYEAIRDTPPIELSPQALGVHLLRVRRALAQLECLNVGYTEQLRALIKSGVPVPGWGATTSPGKEVWNAPIEDVKDMAAMCGVDIDTPGILTPNQSRTAGLSPDIVAQYSERNKPSYKIEPDNAKLIEEIFKNG